MVDNVIQYVLSLKDEFSAKLAGAQEKARGFGTTLAEGVTIAAAGFNAFATAATTGVDILTGNYAKLGDVFRMIPGPVGEAAGAIASFAGAAVTKLTDAADAFDKLSQKTGASVEFLSGFTEAADDVRVSAGAVESGLVKFSRALGGIVSAEDGMVQGGKPLADTLKDLGIQAEDASGKMRGIEEILPQVADLFETMPDGAQKTALAVQLFGKSGAELIPILNKGSDEIRKMMGSAKELGTVITGETVESMKALKAQQDEVSDNWKAFEYAVARSAIPALSAGTKGLLEFAGAMKEGNKSLLSTVDVWKTLFEITRDNVNQVYNPKPIVDWGDAYGESLDKISNKSLLAAAAASALQSQILNAAKSNTTAGFGEDLFDPSKPAAMAKSENDLAVAGAGAAKYQKDLATAIGDMKSAASGAPKALDDLGKLQAGIGLAQSGDVKAFERQKAGEAITLAVSQGKLAVDEGARIMGGLATQAVTVEGAFQKAGGGAKFLKDEMLKIEGLAKAFEAGGKFPEYAGKATVAAMAAEDAAAAGLDKFQAKWAGLSETPITLRLQDEGYDSLKTKYDSIRDKTVRITFDASMTGGDASKQRALDELITREQRSQAAAGGPQ